MDKQTLEVIAETLIEIRDELRRNRPATEDVQVRPDRVRRVKDGKRPNEPYVPTVVEAPLNPILGGQSRF
jgi:hypothetical protein